MPEGLLAARVRDSRRGIAVRDPWAQVGRPRPHSRRFRDTVLPGRGTRGMRGIGYALARWASDLVRWEPVCSSRAVRSSADGPNRRNELTSPPLGIPAAFARIPVGVAIITTSQPDGPLGLTGMVWAEAPDPPLLLTTLRRPGATRRWMLEQHRFGISLLSAAQSDLTWQFASETRSAVDRFAGGCLSEHQRRQRAGHSLPGAIAAAQRSA